MIWNCFVNYEVLGAAWAGGPQEVQQFCEILNDFAEDTRFVAFGDEEDSEMDPPLSPFGDGIDLRIMKIMEIAKKISPTTWWHDREHHWADCLFKIGACPDAILWSRDFASANDAWAACPFGDWMAWLLEKGGRDRETRRAARALIASTPPDLAMLQGLEIEPTLDYVWKEHRIWSRVSGSPSLARRVWDRINAHIKTSDRQGGATEILNKAACLCSLAHKSGSTLAAGWGAIVHPLPGAERAAYDARFADEIRKVCSARVARKILERLVQG